MKRTFKAVALGMCGMLLAGGFTACDKENETKTPQKPSYNLALVNPEDANIVLNDNEEEVFYVAITTDAPVEELAVAEKTGATWCDAAVHNSDSIRVIPGANTSEEDMSATFVVSVKDNDVVKPVEFTVVRRGTSTEYTISVSGEGIEEGEYGTLCIRPAADVQTVITLTVNTNAARWFLSDMNQVYDDDFNPVEWYTLDKTSGRSGQTVTITVSPNAGADNRMTSLTFKYDEESWEGVYVTIDQPAAPATEVVFYDEDYEPIEGSEYAVALDKDDAGTFGEFYVEKNGSVDYKVCAAGTTTPVDEDNQWIFVGVSYDGSLMMTSMANNTGAARALDVVVTPLGSETVLFRFKVTQAGE